MIESLQEFMNSKRSLDPLIEGIIAKGELVMLFGESGVGKSFSAVDFALSVASGQPWLGRAVSQGPVVYLPSEGFDGFRSRIQAWCSHHGLSHDDIPMHMGSHEFPLNETVEFNELELYFDDIRPKPKLIVIDTLTGMTQGLDQNSAKDMAAFADICKFLKLMTDATVLVVHHSGHKDKGRSKGAVDFWAACDKVISLRRVGRDGTLAIQCAKNRNGEPFEDIYVKLEQCEPSALVVEAEKPTSAGKSSLNRGDQIFREVIGAGAISEADAKAAFGAKYDKSAGANRNAWNRAFEKAQVAGLIEIDGSGLISFRTHTAQT